MADEDDKGSEELEEESTPSAADTLKSILNRSDKIIRASQKSDILEATEAEDDSEGLPVLEECWSDLRNELLELREKIDKEIEAYPMLRLSMKVVEKLMDEYRRLDEAIENLNEVLTETTNNRAGQERSRMRDNITQLVIERWRLLNAIQDNVHKVFNAVIKAKDKEGPLDDPFAQYNDIQDVNEDNEEEKDEQKGST